MGIKKLFGDIYYADYRDTRGIRRRISLETTNLVIAQKKYADIMHKRNAVNERHIVDIEWEVFKEKLFKFMATERAQSTITWTKLAIKHLEDVQKPRLLRDVTPVLVQQVKQRMLEEGCGKHNVNRCMQALKAIMHLAEKWELAPEQNWKIIEKLKTPKGRVVFHTDEEIDRLLAACPSDIWRLVVLLGCEAGLRRGEIAHLLWQDVDFKSGQIYVAPHKTENFRFVPMSPNLREALEKAKIGARKEFVVDVGWDECRDSKDFLTAFYHQIAQKAGVSSFMHKLRHTFASQMVQDGVDLYTVSKLMGHSSIQMTEIYAHLSPRNFKEAVQIFPKRAYTAQPVKGGA